MTEAQKVNRNRNSELTMVQSLIVILLLKSDKVLELFYFQPKNTTENNPSQKILKTPHYLTSTRQYLGLLVRRMAKSC